MATIIPPIKSQGIKTQLIPWINRLISRSGIDPHANWIEPFFGTGVVGFNSPLQGNFIVGDTNPHIINFYEAINHGEMTGANMRQYLQQAATLLENAGDNGNAYYLEVRNRFNMNHDLYDFIFLSRAGFNGMMRFNRNGNWNIPFCKKPTRFAPAYITKICNQIENVSRVIHTKHWTFNISDFEAIIAQAHVGDLIYCDPPYYGRYVDYYNGWTEEDEERLFRALNNTQAHFILSTWHHNEFRVNPMIERFWGHFNVMTRDHYYHSGGHIENRHPVVEALVYNFDIDENIHVENEDNVLF